MTIAANGVVFGELSQFIGSVNSSITSGLSEFLNKVGSGLLTEAQKLEQLGNYYDKQFTDYAAKAREWASRADAASRPEASRIWNTIANHFEDVAAERGALGTQAWTEAQLKNFTGTVAKYTGVAGVAVDVAQMSEAVANGNYNRLGEVSMGVFYGTFGTVLGGAFVAAMGVSLLPAAIIVGFSAYAGSELGEWVWNRVGPYLTDQISDFFLRAQRWVFRGDPLTFDLDGDGIETVPLNPANPILFDHDADGVKIATGWIKADDAFLVLDRNGNGTIDNGAELFGDSTPLSAGGNAADGFAALTDQDTNADGQVNANDANFANLRLWQDLNQDGISQAGELFTLNQKGIASITVAKTENNTVLPDGNVLADIGSYTKTDGTVGGIGEIGHLGDVDLASNTFFSSYTDTVPLTPEVQQLPDMHGSGRVRNLREAASLSGEVSSVLTTYANTTTCSEWCFLLMRAA